MTLWRGVGGDFSPNPRALEAMLSKRLKARGAPSIRKNCVYTSTNIAQARDYRAKDCDSTLFLVQPQPGAILAWLHNCFDVVTSLESFTKDLWYDDVTHLESVPIKALMQDSMGSVCTLNDYAAYKRQQRALNAILDAFLDTYTLHTAPYNVVPPHDGEVWITGPSVLIPYQQAIAA